ncbi:zinc ABC transporter permease [Candidatus Dependentiae bacterium Noda2021]|nr:zinc ABC transporter permease [Candidatus Dependentiae bacterium Noda2021]
MNIIFDYTLLMVIVGTTMLGITAGALSSFAFLRKQSLLGDAISHAALPGIVLACLVTHQKNPYVLMSGAGIAGAIGTGFIYLVLGHTAIKSDTILGVVLSVFFGFGLVLISLLKKYPSLQAGSMQKFLFGNASSFTTQELHIVFMISCLVLLCIILLWKEFKLLSFDRDFAHNAGFATNRINVVLTSLLVITIIIGLQTVGVILMSTMLIAPGAAARQWTNRLERMVILSGTFGAIACVAGSCVSSMFAHIPTGPTIVIFLSIIVFVSLACAPARSIHKHKVVS